jgi:hypothetical protein
MIYHIFPGNCEHLVLTMIDFFSTQIHDSSADVNYIVLFSNDTNKVRYDKKRSLSFIDSNKQLKDFFFTIKKSDTVILHSTLHGIIWKYLFLRPTIWTRIIWVAWGGDFYFEDFLNPKTLRKKINQIRKTIICQRIGAICTLVPGDYDLIAQALKCKNKYFRAFYSSHSLKKYAIPDQWYDVNTTPDTLKILVGNSAAKTNCHIEAFDLLYHFRTNDINIICPLGYPETCREYRELVISKGYEYFGNKFVPILNVVDYEDYKLMLDPIDILVFNHPRQQGLFNLYYFIFHGKKVFLPKEATTYTMLKEMNIAVYDTKNIKELSFEEFATMALAQRKLNIELAQKNLSIERSIQSWNNLFSKYHYKKKLIENGTR